MLESSNGATSPKLLTHEIYTVSRLNQEVRLVLTTSFPLLRVEGEISNLASPSSGHLYFTLKDANAQVRCAMFRNRNITLRLRPENGMQVLLHARVGLYERRGEFQLTVEHMEKAGLGALQQAFEALKRRLAGEGLFDASRKKSLPAFPRQLGVITSPTGAAIRDILSILQRRYPTLPVLIYPVPVQGEGAANAIAETLGQASQRQECDVLIIARGGGSLEDLWSFNEETVARAIAACEIPIVSGIGHEIDFTIADFAADHRAPTPSAAAEFVSPDRHELLTLLSQHHKALLKGLKSRLQQLWQRFIWCQGRLRQQHPRQRLQQHSQRLDDLERHLHQVMTIRLKSLSEKLKILESQLQQQSPETKISRAQSYLGQLEQRLQSAMQERLSNNTHRLDKVLQALHTLSPQATLSRGYAIVTRKSDGAIIRKRADVDRGSQVLIQLAKDRLAAQITDT